MKFLWLEDLAASETDVYGTVMLNIKQQIQPRIRITELKNLNLK